MSCVERWAKEAMDWLQIYVSSVVQVDHEMISPRPILLSQMVTYRSSRTLLKSRDDSSEVSDPGIEPLDLVLQFPNLSVSFPCLLREDVVLIFESPDHAFLILCNCGSHSPL